MLAGTTDRRNHVGANNNDLSSARSVDMSSTMSEAWPEQVSDAITPDQSPERASGAIAACFENIGVGLVVMHQPIISRLVYYLTGQDQPWGLLTWLLSKPHKLHSDVVN